MEEALFVTEYPMRKNEFLPNKELAGTSRGWNGFLKYVIIAVAVALFICPDPFTDILAFWLMGKVSVSTNFKALARRMKNTLRDLAF